MRSRKVALRTRRFAVTVSACIAAAPALGAIGDGIAPETYRGNCALVASCTVSGRCADLPAPGRLRLEIDETRAWLGPEGLAPIEVDIHADLAAAFPLPALDPDTPGARHEFLVPAQSDGAIGLRLYALYIQRGPDPGDGSALGPIYHLIECREADR